MPGPAWSGHRALRLALPLGHRVGREGTNCAAGRRRPHGSSEAPARFQPGSRSSSGSQRAAAPPGTAPWPARLRDGREMDDLYSSRGRYGRYARLGGAGGAGRGRLLLASLAVLRAPLPFLIYHAGHVCRAAPGRAGQPSQLGAPPRLAPPPAKWGLGPARCKVYI